MKQCFSLLILLIPILPIIACRDEAPEPVEPQVVQPQRPERSVEPMVDSDVEIFFGTTGGSLETERATIEKSELSPEQLIEALVTKLLEGPSTSSELVATFPKGTIVRAVYILEGEVAVVDLQGEQLRDWSTGSSAEMAAAYSLVNTVTGNVPEIRSVQILIEGREVETLAGHLDLTRPLRPRNL